MNASHRQNQAIEAASTIARQQGLQFDQAIVLKDWSNVIVHLTPTPVVARVATSTTALRPGHEWFQREVAIAKHLTSLGAPIVPVSSMIEPGPHEALGMVLSFWEYVQVLDEPSHPQIIGETLRTCHLGLQSFSNDLPLLMLITEAQQILQQLIASMQISQDDGAMLDKIADRTYESLSQMPSQPLHGDSHFGNMLNTDRGVLWTDWEDSFIGPVEWDLACFVSTAQVFGTDVEASELALSGYGNGFDREALDICVVARTFVALIWSVILAQQHPSNDHASRIKQRLDWLRKRA